MGANPKTIFTAFASAVALFIISWLCWSLAVILSFRQEESASLTAPTVALAPAVATATDDSAGDTLTLPIDSADWGESKIRHGTLEESKRRVKEAAPIMRHCRWPYFDFPANFNSTLAEIKTAAIDLGRADDPNAEYIIGWMYENGIVRSSPPWTEIQAGGVEITHTDISEDDMKRTQKWYSRAADHGSPYALGALGRYEEAIAGGNIEANIDLGSRIYKPGLDEKDLKRVMQLFELATKSDDENTVNNGVQHVIWLWSTEHVMPSPEFARGAKSAFDFVRRFDPELDAQKLLGIYSNGGATPDCFAQYRAPILAKIRYSLAAS